MEYNNQWRAPQQWRQPDRPLDKIRNKCILSYQYRIWLSDGCRLLEIQLRWLLPGKKRFTLVVSWWTVKVRCSKPECQKDIHFKGDLQSVLRMTRHLCFVFSEQDGEKLGEYSAGISLRRSSLSEKILFWVQVMKRKREKFTILKEVSFVCKYRCIYLIYPIYLIPNIKISVCKISCSQNILEATCPSVKRPSAKCSGTNIVFTNKLSRRWHTWAGQTASHSLQAIHLSSPDGYLRNACSPRNRGLRGPFSKG